MELMLSSIEFGEVMFTTMLSGNSSEPSARCHVITGCVTSAVQVTSSDPPRDITIVLLAGSSEGTGMGRCNSGSMEGGTSVKEIVVDKTAEVGWRGSISQKQRKHIEQENIAAHTEHAILGNRPLNLELLSTFLHTSHMLYKLKLEQACACYALVKL